MDIEPWPIDQWFSRLFLQLPWPLTLLTGVLCGILASRASTHWIERMARDEAIFAPARCARCGKSNHWLWWWPSCRGCQASRTGELLWGLLVCGMFMAHVYLLTRWECQALVDAGSINWIHWRVLSQGWLLFLLLTATGIDFREYLIPDEITILGMLSGVVLATAIGHLQIVPVWIDWNQEVPGLSGPFVPEWIKHHPHWHGLAWSLTGLLVGGGATWLVRSVSGWLLGQEALGFGDVTLMAMIGSFVGWQAVLLVFALAPLCGLLISLLVPLITGKYHVPYGPFLSVSAVAVLWSWKWIWPPLRYIFGHPPSIAGLVGGSMGLLCLLLGLWRLYRSIPVTGRGRQVSGQPSIETPPSATE